MRWRPNGFWFAFATGVRPRRALVLAIIGGFLQLSCATREAPATARVTAASSRPAGSPATATRDPFKKLRDALDRAARKGSLPQTTARPEASLEAGLRGTGESPAVGTSGVESPPSTASGDASAAPDSTDSAAAAGADQEETQTVEPPGTWGFATAALLVILIAVAAGLFVYVQRSRRIGG